MIVLGLTGSIGMGKSVAAAQLRALGLPVFDADSVVHELYGNPDIIAAIRAILPREYKSRDIDRKTVSAAVQQNPELYIPLESILHPRVRAAESAFLADAEKNGHDIAVLDIPLLFESGDFGRCDHIAVVTAPKLIQAFRVLRRPNMNLAKFLQILSRQMPDGEKRRRADFIVRTGFGRDFSLYQWKKIIRRLRGA